MKKTLTKQILILGILTGALCLSACAAQESGGQLEEAEKEADGGGENVAKAAQQLEDLSSLQRAGNLQNMDESGYYNGATEEEMQAFYLEEGGEIVLLTGNSKVMDESYQQAIYEGIRYYAFSAEKTYSYYSPGGTAESDYEACMDRAIDCGAKLIVCGGWEYDIIIGRYQDRYPDIDFLIVDGEPEDENEEVIPAKENVHCIYCDCTTAGYLAGYMCVLEGYRKFGFMGGEVMQSVWLYGHGFMKGMDDAAKNLGCADEVSLNYTYTGTWLPDDDIYDKACEWYDDGTEVIFSCGGGIYESILAAAEEKGKYMIGVDVNQNLLSDAVITSAINGVSTGVINALDDYFAYEGWPDELAGKARTYGSTDRCASLPYDNASWHFKNVTVDDYFKLYSRITTREIIIENSEEMPQVSYSVNVINTGAGE